MPAGSRRPFKRKCGADMEGLKTREFWIPLIVVTAVACVLSNMIAQRRADLYELKLRHARLEAELAEALEVNEQLRAERRALLRSPEYVERVAREDYGYTAPGEVLANVDVPKAEENTVVIDLPDKFWDRLMGWGGFPWRIPVAVFLISFIIFMVLELYPRDETARSEK